MDDGRWSFTFFRSFFEAVQAIDDKEVRADFYDAICQYAINGTTPDDISAIAKALFILAKPNLDVSRKKAEAGGKGGRSAKQEESKPKANDKQTRSKHEANDKQTASDREERIENIEERIEIEKEIEKRDDREERIEKRDIEADDLAISDEIACRSQDVRRVVDAWNSLGLSRVNKILLDTDRGKMLRKRIKDYGIDDVLRAVENVRASPFLNGNNKNGWQATFDWFVRPNNFPKVLDGNYSTPNKGRVSQGNEFGDNIFLQLAEEGKYG